MSYILEAAKEGFVFECGCGELYRSADHAWNCRKCRTYLSDEAFFSRNVTDTRTGADVPLEWSQPTSIDSTVEV